MPTNSSIVDALDYLAFLNHPTLLAGEDADRLLNSTSGEEASAALRVHLCRLAHALKQIKEDLEGLPDENCDIAINDSKLRELIPNFQRVIDALTRVEELPSVPSAPVQKSKEELIDLQTKMQGAIGSPESLIDLCRQLKNEIPGLNKLLDVVREDILPPPELGAQNQERIPSSQSQDQNGANGDIPPPELEQEERTTTTRRKVRSKKRKRTESEQEEDDSELSVSSGHQAKRRRKTKTLRRRWTEEEENFIVERFKRSEGQYYNIDWKAIAASGKKRGLFVGRKTPNMAIRDKARTLLGAKRICDLCFDWIQEDEEILNCTKSTCEAAQNICKSGKGRPCPCKAAAHRDCVIDRDDVADPATFVCNHCNHQMEARDEAEKRIEREKEKRRQIEAKRKKEVQDLMSEEEEEEDEDEEDEDDEEEEDNLNVNLDNIQSTRSRKNRTNQDEADAEDASSSEDEEENASGEETQREAYKETVTRVMKRKKKNSSDSTRGETQQEEIPPTQPTQDDEIIETEEVPDSPMRE